MLMLPTGMAESRVNTYLQLFLSWKQAGFSQNRRILKMWDLQHRDHPSVIKIPRNFQRDKENPSPLSFHKDGND